MSKTITISDETWDKIKNQVEEKEEKKTIRILDKDGDLLKEVEGDTLREADLKEADLKEADLRGANLSEANLSEANLSEAKFYGKGDVFQAKINKSQINDFLTALGVRVE